MKTTLNKIREHQPCKDGWEKLLKHLGKTKADDESLSLLTILDSNGFEDALWCLRAVDGYEKEMRLFAVWCARQVQHFVRDQRSINAINVAEKYAHGQATEIDLKEAREAASEVAGSTAMGIMTGAAGYATWTAEYATWAVECAAARAASRDAVMAVACYSEITASSVAEWQADWSTAKFAQEAELRRMLNEIEEQIK